MIISGKGQKISIPSFSITISDHGEMKSEMHGEIELGYDMCPYWLDIAYDHLVKASKFNEKVKVAVGKELNRYLEKEFLAGMQSITASCIAIDAYLVERIELPPDLINSWRSGKKGTARYKQVTEVLRRSFSLSNEQTQSINGILKAIYSFRDRAVHPSAKTAPTVNHPEIGTRVEYRLAAYRAENAFNAIGHVYEIIELSNARAETCENQKLKEYCSTLIKDISPTFKKWKRKYNVVKKAS
ncbi:hypothetical protein [Candidatus Colwellia aromaticivorans]|uniref:hypothetical protein n=1 Tax=Candidatus Colwellia aromaticivorans TaxID=2267621 RepID=UPI000DF49569|nr:hypothetical protein [Candidatus Colwellia aromaticivorans]